MTRTMVFIDGSNLYHSLRERYGRTDIDFAKLCNYLANGRELVRGYYYNATVDQGREEARYGDQQRFFDRLRRVPKLEVRLGTLVYPQAWPQAPLMKRGSTYEWQPTC